VTDYLLIESRDPFESNDTQTLTDLAKDLKRQGHGVTLFLVQNGVLPARPCAVSAALSDVAQAGIEVLADDFSLSERGISERRLAEGVQAASLEVVVDQLAAGRKAIWH
jgi:predicted peroxiredoxin